jgi:hypothetical protein
MAKKKVAPDTNVGGIQEAKFTKEQILASDKYANRKDVINAIWVDESEKTISQIESLIEKFMKGKVN